MENKYLNAFVKLLKRHYGTNNNTINTVYLNNHYGLDSADSMKVYNEYFKETIVKSPSKNIVSETDYLLLMEKSANTVDWNMSFGEDYVNFQQHSTLGEDVNIYINIDNNTTVEDIPRELYRYHNSYDIDERVMLLKQGCCKNMSLIDLIEDSKEIEISIESLYDTINGFTKEYVLEDNDSKE